MESLNFTPIQKFLAWCDQQEDMLLADLNIVIGQNEICRLLMKQVVRELKKILAETFDDKNGLQQLERDIILQKNSDHFPQGYEESHLQRARLLNRQERFLDDALFEALKYSYQSDPFSVVVDQIRVKSFNYVKDRLQPHFSNVSSEIFEHYFTNLMTYKATVAILSYMCVSRNFQDLNDKECELVRYCFSLTGRFIQSAFEVINGIDNIEEKVKKCLENAIKQVQEDVYAKYYQNDDHHYDSDSFQRVISDQIMQDQSMNEQEDEYQLTADDLEYVAQIIREEEQKDQDSDVNME